MINKEEEEEETTTTKLQAGSCQRLECGAALGGEAALTA
jgi:hypothetical protein